MAWWGWVAAGALLLAAEMGVVDGQLAQTTLRSEIGKIDLDRTFEERALINAKALATRVLRAEGDPAAPERG